MSRSPTLRIPFRPGELERVRAVAAECGETPEQFARSILLATLPVAPLDGASETQSQPVSAPPPKPLAAKRVQLAPAQGSAALILVDPAEASRPCKGCGQQVVRAKSRRFARTYDALAADIDFSTKPPSVGRHLCKGGGR